MHKFVCILIVLHLGTSYMLAQKDSTSNDRVDLALIKEISGNINPHDVVFTTSGAFFVPNSATHHTTSIFDRTYFKVKDIKDEVFLSDYFYHEYRGEFRGDPYRGVASPDGKHVWIANYSMQGHGFTNPGFQNCISPGHFDPSFVYKVNTSTYQIQTVIKVGSTPSHVAISPNGRYLLVTARCGGELSVIDTEIEVEKFRIPLGVYPSGVCVNSSSTRAYVALTGEDLLLEVDLLRGSISRFIFKGRTPYDIKLGPSDRYLFVSYLKEGRIGKIDLKKRRIVKKLDIGRWAGDILLSPNGRYLYVLDHKKPSITKVRTEDMTIIQKLSLPSIPRGMDLDPVSSQLWIAMESGIGVFEDISMNGVRIYTPNPFASREDSVPLTNYDIKYQDENTFVTRTPSQKPEKVYHIIVGSYHTMQKAEARKSVMESIGFESCIIIPASSGFFRLSIKQYADLTQATKDLPQIKEKFDPEAWILDNQDDSP